MYLIEIIITIPMYSSFYINNLEKLINKTYPKISFSKS